MSTKKINIPTPIKKYPTWKLPDIIVPRTIIDNTYSAVFVKTLTKRFFSLSLNFKLTLFYDHLLQKSRSIFSRIFSQNTPNVSPLGRMGENVNGGEWGLA